MRNTDRGSDNYMIKPCEATHEKSLIDVAPSAAQQPRMPSIDGRPQMVIPIPEDASYFPQQSPPSNAEGSSYIKRPHMHIAAIDNSLSFPHEHPKGWRSYTYGTPQGTSFWRSNLILVRLALPTCERDRTVRYSPFFSCDAESAYRPFSEQTRKQILPLLTSKEWWEETTYQLRKLFAVDPGYHPAMFRVCPSC